MSDATENLLEILSLEQVLRTVPSGLFLVDLEQRIVYWNAEAERITGYGADEILGKHCSLLSGIPCGNRCGLFEPSVPKPIIGGRCSILDKKGRRVVLLKNIDYLRNGDGHVIGGVESFIDVTQQVNLEEELRRQAAVLEQEVERRTAELECERNQLRSLLDAMTDFAYICTPERRIVLMNRAMEEAFGPQGGKSCFEAFFSRHSPCEECPMEQVLAGETVRQERRIGDGGRVYEILHSPLKGMQGTLQKLAVFRDVTERKEVEEKLREANRELDAFVYTVSHDLRAPLTPVIAYAEFIAEEYGDRLDPQALDALREIESQGHKMLALMEDLLSLARAGHVKLSEAPVDPDDLLNEVLADLSDDIAKNGAEIRTFPLPPLSIPATLLLEIFYNLLGNALRYAGGPGALIEIGGESHRDWVRLFVRDHGPGIPEEERGRIFDPFYRGSTAGGSSGTGIGLATVRKIVRLYNGRVWVETTPGGGSTFLLEFPSPSA